MGREKKTGKGRLDKFYHLAKEQGYRARSAFKLVQLNRKYNFLHKARVLIDLCAAPGGWLQVAAKHMPMSSLIVGVDLVPIRPIPNVITLVDDITTEKCRTDLRRELKTWKADVVLHDGSPNMGQAWIQDAFTQSELTLKSLKLACEFLVAGGVFVTKVFRSKDYNALLWVFNQLFKRVEVTKPSSSRSVSAEIYVIGIGYLDPKHLDPKFLDPKFVFSEVEDPSQALGATQNIFHPEKSKRHRDGYEDNARILFKSCPITTFISAADPITILATHNQFVFDEDDEECRRINALPRTTDEIRALCADLKVIGKRDFKELLRWRERIVEAAKKEADAAAGEGDADNDEDLAAVVSSEAVDDELLDAELKALEESASKDRKREKRRKNALKAKLRERIRLNMEVPNDTALMVQDDALFSLKRIRSDRALDVVAEADLNADGDDDDEFAAPERRAIDFADGSNGDYHTTLESMLDTMYEQYLERKGGSRKRHRLATIKAEKARVSGDPFADAHNGAGDDDDEDPDEAEATNSLLTNGSAAEARSRKASMWFSQPLFAGIAAGEEEEEEEEDDEEAIAAMKKARKMPAGGKRKRAAESDEEEEEEDTEAMEGADSDEADQDSDSDNDSDASFEEVPASSLERDGDDDGDASKRRQLTPAEIAVATMLRSSAHRADLLDKAYNRYAFNDDGLPAWFAQEESKFTTPAVPVTKEAVQQHNEMMKEINARPIKKIAEAKARKKRKTIKRLERVKAQASAIAEQEDLSEAAKAKQIDSLYKAKLKKKEPKKVQVVVAKGATRGKGRPKGVKGRYKMVDARLRKDMKALKRVEAKKTKGKRKK